MSLVGVGPVQLPISTLVGPEFDLSSLLDVCHLETILATTDRFRVITFLVSCASDLLDLALEPSVSLKSVNAYRLLVSGCLVGLDTVLSPHLRSAAFSILSSDPEQLVLARLCEISSAFFLRQPQLVAEHGDWLLSLLPHLAEDCVCDLFCELPHDQFISLWLGRSNFPNLLLANINNENLRNAMKIASACCDSPVLLKKFSDFSIASTLLSYRNATAESMSIARKIISTCEDDRISKLIRSAAIECLQSRGDSITPGVVTAIDVLTRCAENGDIVQDIADTFLDMMQIHPNHSILMSAIVRYMSETAKWIEGHNEVLRIVPSMIAEIQIRRCVVVAEAAAQILMAVDSEAEFDDRLRHQLHQISEYVETIEKCVRPRCDADNEEWGQ